MSTDAWLDRYAPDGAEVASGLLDLWFFVPGVPAPQGSKRFVGLSKAGHGVLVESSKKVKPWRATAALAAENAMAGKAPFLEPLEVSWTFVFARPKGHFGARGNVLPSARPYPTGYPDLSKVIRSTEDALTGIVWRDDAQVVRYGKTAKVYGERPGCHVRIRVLR